MDIPLLHQSQLETRKNILSICAGHSMGRTTMGVVAGNSVRNDHARCIGKLQLARLIFDELALIDRSLGHDNPQYYIWDKSRQATRQ